jgi:hypothetical protein
MLRTCTRCLRPFHPENLAREESRRLVHDRKAADLEGVRFLYYHCFDCGTDDLFVDVIPRVGELLADYVARKLEMDEVVRRLREEAEKSPEVDMVVVPVAAR